jgi:hypothetical protein
MTIFYEKTKKNRNFENGAKKGYFEKRHTKTAGKKGGQKRGQIYCEGGQKGGSPRGGSGMTPRIVVVLTPHSLSGSDTPSSPRGAPSQGIPIVYEKNFYNKNIFTFGWVAESIVSKTKILSKILFFF